MLWIILLVLIGGFVLVIGILQTLVERDRPQDSVWKNSIESDEEYRQRMERMKGPRWKGHAPDPLWFGRRR